MLYYPLVTKILFGLVALTLVIESDIEMHAEELHTTPPPTISSSFSNNVIVHGSSGSGLSTIVRSPYLPQQVLQRSLNANVQEGGSALFIPQSNGRKRFKSAATDLEGSAAKRKRGIKTWTMGFIRR